MERIGSIDKIHEDNPDQLNIKPLFWKYSSQNLINAVTKYIYNRDSMDQDDIYEMSRYIISWICAYSDIRRKELQEIYDGTCKSLEQIIDRGLDEGADPL